ncbi:MAG: hypothetical protein LBG58_05270 [Planctomycetaceae bacterium]|jgi:hypothetical protein|nr:hypothetical protein [Planctomycetaceae bacterium]
MKLNKNDIVMVMFLFVLAIQTGCQQKLPDGFPEQLVPFNVKLTHNGSPVQGAAISFFLEGENLPYLVMGNTNANGVAKMETTMNVFSQSGVPSGTYTAMIIHVPKPQSPNADFGKMSNAEIDAHIEKIDAEIAAMPHPVPKEWSNIKTTPIKITVPENGGSVTIEITDSKTFVQ